MIDRNDQSRRLAAVHFDLEDGITQIFRLVVAGEAEARPDEPIKLLEVNQNTIAAGIMPLQFAPAPDAGFHAPSIIVEVTPQEFDQLRRSELSLPAGWSIGEEIPRTSSSAVA